MTIGVNTDSNNDIIIDVGTDTRITPDIVTTALYGPKGDKGDKGDTGSQGIQGETGATGATGNGISTIEKTSTSGLVDTYTITYTNTNTDTFTVTNGQDGADGADGQNGQDGYSPTATVSKSGSTATITITDKNGTTTETITDGQNGANGQDGQDGYSPTATVTKSGSTATITITDKNGTTTASVSDGAGGVTDVEVNGTSVVTSGVASITISQAGVSGSYNDLTDKPTIPAAQVNADWNSSSGVSEILNKPTIPTVPTNLSSFTDDLGSSPTHTHSQYITDVSGKANVSLSNVTDSGTSLGAGWAMPSDTCDGLTVGATGTSYTAPANGWFTAYGFANDTSQVIALSNSTNYLFSASYANATQNRGVCLPALKGDEVKLFYTGGITAFYFVYAQGSESEAS